MFLGFSSARHTMLGFAWCTLTFLSVQVTQVACVLWHNWWCDESMEKRDKEEKNTRTQWTWSGMMEVKRADGETFPSSRRKKMHHEAKTQRLGKWMEQFNLNLGEFSEYELKEMGWENWLKRIECSRDIIAAIAMPLDVFSFSFWFLGETEIITDAPLLLSPRLKKK